ncbi:ribosomal protein S18-alanine N-acetyltransferase [bacterium]|nr:ribosomal protein S18-alanine N-acetyltransferase [bacterium]
MTKNDIDGIIDIEKMSYGEHHWSKDSFYAELSNNLAKYFCAFDINNKLLGYAGSWIVLDEAHITNIAVSPEYRGKKIGEALLAKIFETCYKNMVKYLTLEVRVSNTPAIKLYEKYSFKSLGTRKGYYQNNNEDALIMWTENIFWDKFKEKFNENILKLQKEITIL